MSSETATSNQRTAANQPLFQSVGKKIITYINCTVGVLFINFFLYVAIYLYLLYDLMILVILRYYFRLRNLILILMDSAIMPIKLYIYQKFVCFFLSVYIITSNRFFCFYKKNCLMLNL